jgi:malate permease and related proteins
VQNLVIIAVSLVAGVLLRKSNLLPDSTPKWLNRYVIWVALPVTILFMVPFMQFEWAMLLPASMPWLQFILGALLFWLLKTPLGLEQRTLGALILTASLGNTSFVGFPMLSALMGQNALATAIIIDQAGSFLVVSTLGVITASVFSHESTTWRSIAKRVITFPPFVVLIIALMIRQTPIPLAIMLLADYFRAVMFTLGPAALLAVGYQLRFDKALLRKHRSALSAGLGYKLMLSPVIVALVYALTPLSREEWLATVLEAGMAPMITAAIIANEHGLDEELTSLMVGIGIPLSILTVPLLHLILR